MKKIRVVLLLAVLLCGCGKTMDTTIKEEKLQVVTSFYPVYLLAQAITEGAEGMELRNMAQPQTGCLHDYELTISDRKILESADVLLINGGGMEGFLSLALEQYPELIIVDTSADITLLAGEEHRHQHEEQEESHAHEVGGNPHIWLSPERAMQQAEVIAKELSARNEVDAALFAENLEAFRGGVHALRESVHQIGIPEGEFVAVFHEGFAYIAELFHMEPVFDIFADEYEMPSARELADAADEAKEHRIQYFLTAADHGAIYAKTLAAEVGETVLYIDPLTTDDEAGHSYLERMEKNIEAIEKHWKERAE